MRVMVIVKATKSSEAGVMPTEQLLADMGKYNEELEAEDFGEEFTPELRKQEEQLRAEIERRQS